MSNVVDDTKSSLLNSLKGFKCVELKGYHHDRPKAAKCKNYTKDPDCWFEFPDVPNRYGVLLDVNNLLVVDIDYPDKKDYKDFPPTFTVKTGGGGYHLYYKNPCGLKSNHRVVWGEIKTSGHVVGFGVKHESGYYYEVVRDHPISVIRKCDLLEHIKDVPNVEKRKQPAAARLHPNNVDPSGCEGFEFITSDIQRTKVVSILKSNDPTHNDRCWLVGFLGYIGLNYNGILNLIHDYNEWCDYDRETTEIQITSILKGAAGGIDG